MQGWRLCIVKSRGYQCCLGGNHLRVHGRWVWRERGQFHVYDEAYNMPFALLTFLGFCSEKEIKNKTKKRADFLPVSSRSPKGSPPFTKFCRTNCTSHPVGTITHLLLSTAQRILCPNRRSMINIQVEGYPEVPRIMERPSSAAEAVIAGLLPTQKSSFGRIYIMVKNIWTTLLHD
jgi:hypothetical protein